MVVCYQSVTFASCVRRSKRSWLKRATSSQLVPLWLYAEIFMVSSMIFSNFLKREGKYLTLDTSSWEISLIVDITLWRLSNSSYAWNWNIQDILLSYVETTRLGKSPLCTVSTMRLSANTVMQTLGNTAVKSLIISALELWLKGKFSASMEVYLLISKPSTKSDFLKEEWKSLTKDLFATWCGPTLRR